MVAADDLPAGARRLDKRDLFLKMHENLLDPSAVRGRRLLYRITAPEIADAIVADEDQQTDVYRALAGFDVLGLYVDRGWVDRWTVLEEWGNSLSLAVEPKALFIAAKYPGKKFHSWPHYDDLAREAVGFRDGTVRPSLFIRARREVRAVFRRTRHRGRLRP